MSSIVILGCGPAGLAAATAAVNLGHKVLIISNSNKPSRQYGCQYLHAPVPGYESVHSTVVGYYLQGTPEQYRRKVYGTKWQGKVSPEDFVGEHIAWDIRQTYRHMWDDLGRNKNVDFWQSPTILAGAVPAKVYEFNPEFIISTIPAPSLCSRKIHSFNYHTIFASGSMSPDDNVTDTIVCDGTDEHAWYRRATVFGYRTTEWSGQPTGGEHVAVVAKPLATNCDCEPHIHRVGRYGKWEKGYLVHQVYPEVMEILK